MLELNKKSNVLEEETYRYTVQDVAEPNLYRDIYPYTEIPRIAFNHRRVPMNMPEKIWITDTTFRDGQQSRSPYTVQQIVDIYRMLSRLGGPEGIIRQTEFFVYSEKDRQALYKCRELGLEFPEITTWIRASKKDFQLVKDLELRETGILVSCSDYHIFNKLKMTRKQAMDHYLSVAADAMELGISPRCHLEDITRADFYGFVVPFVNELMDMSAESGIPIKIRACDTMGYGVPYSEASPPRSVPGLIYGLQHHSAVPSEWLEWHGHNDFYKGVTNAATAWLFGASAVNCSLFGIDTTVITELADYYRNVVGYAIPPMTPFVGESFNVTRAGIHADGLLKDEEIYNIFDTAKILNKPANVAVSNVSGLAGIAFWINNYFNLLPEQKIDKKDPAVQKIKEWIDEEYENGRQTIISDNELIALLKEYKPELFEKK